MRIMDKFIGAVVFKVGTDDLVDYLPEVFWNEATSYPYPSMTRTSVNKYALFSFPVLKSML